MTHRLLEPDFLRKLERLSIVTKRVFLGSTKGERQSKKQGTSIEFADYREYVPGDDFRRIDWPLYARQERLFLKLFVEEEDLFVYVLLDTSLSMDFGGPLTKFDYARQLAAALGYVTLYNLDRLTLSAFSQGVHASYGPLRGKGSALQAFAWLSRLAPDGRTDLNRALREYAVLVKKPGVLFVLSDFLDPGGYEPGLNAVVGRGFDVALIQVLDPTELDPDIRGDLKLVDAETQEKREITISYGSLRRYKRAVGQYCSRLRDWCARHQMGYLLATVASPLEDVLFTSLRKQGFIK